MCVCVWQIQEYMDGLVEVHGTAGHGNQLQADHYINLSSSTANFGQEKKAVLI